MFDNKLVEQYVIFVFKKHMDFSKSKNICMR